MNLLIKFSYIFINIQFYYVFFPRQNIIFNKDAQMFSTGNIDVPIPMPQPVGGDASAAPVADADFGNFETVTPAQPTAISNPMMDMMSPVQSAPVAALPAAQTPISGFPQTPVNVPQTPQNQMSAFSQVMVC